LRRTLRDCPITSAKLHISNLALAEILDDAIGAVTIHISVPKTFFPRDDNHHRALSRRYDPLLLAAVPSVNVRAAIVSSANLECPTHCAPKLALTYRLPKPKQLRWWTFPFRSDFVHDFRTLTIFFARRNSKTASFYLRRES